MGIHKGYLSIWVLAAAACGAPGDTTSSTNQAVTSSNGVYQNGVYQNGLTTNGVYQNGVYQNGVYQNGVYQNGVYQNGVYQNGVYQNGVYQNGVYQNGLWTSGLWSNPVWQVGTNATALRTSAYTRQFLKYVYACAMPGAFDPALGGPTDASAQLAPGYYSTSLDPNSGSLACNAQGGCDDPYYTCDKGTNTCVVQLDGSIGVGVNADGSTWWHTGTCDQTCQSWISACVLARTNAYGVHVDISMRAPDDAPTAVKNALSVSDTERSTYALREGAYFGNLFGTTTVTSGPFTGALMATPTFYACAGPGSNIPEITKRFCSSQGDQAVITVPGTCLPTAQDKPVCAGADTNAASPTFGAIHDCYTSTDWTGLTPTKQVITVFLRAPISVCGNAVCEAGEADSTSAGYCPSDCHAETWANTYDVALLSGFATINETHKLAVGPDSSVVIADLVYGSSPFSLGGPLLSAASNPDIVLAKYDEHGHYLWGTRKPADGNVDAIAIGPDGTIVVVGEGGGGPLTISKFTAAGAAVPGWPISIGGSAAQVGAGMSVAVDHDGNVGIVGMFAASPWCSTCVGTATFGSVTLSTAGASSNEQGFALKVWADGTAHAGGPVAWAVTRSQMQPAAAAFDPAGNLIGAGVWYPNGIYELDATDGHERWNVPVDQPTMNYNWPLSVAADSKGNVYVTGRKNQNFFLDSYAPDGTFRWTVGPKSWCPDDTTNCYSNWDNSSTGKFVTTDAAGNIIVGGTMTGLVDFGAGQFKAYATPNLFVAAYAAGDASGSGGGRFLWARHMPMVLDSQLTGFAVDGNSHVVLAGQYSGSMELDDTLLVNSVPDVTNHPNVFVGSYTEPALTDQTISIGDAVDALGLHFTTVPSTISVEATSSAGATVFFMPPTALDPGGAGTNVICSPAPNTIFPIGTTPVTCTATNAIGATTATQFDVVVHDSLGPTITGVPADVASSTATVSYTLPTAFDQVSGSVPVTCSPASGSVFASGATIVTCTAKDAAGNATVAAFTVTVTLPPDTTPPVIHVPAAMTVPATGPSGAVVTYTATATDNVDGAITPTCAPASGTTFVLGTTTVTCAATDAHNNSATASFTVTVKDLTAPTVIVPSGITVSATGPAGAVATYAAAATDNVDGAVAVSCSPASGSQFALGTTTVTCTAHDAAGNIGSATFLVSVVDTTPPVLTVPAPVTAEATGAAGAAVTFVASATDVVDGAVAPSCSPASGSTFALGTTTVTCTATDAHHNSSTASFTVTVVDTTAPAITVPATIAVPVTGSTTVVTYTTSATDLVDGAVATTCTPPSGSAFALGTTTVTCTASDAHHNTATRTFLVEVQAQWSGILQPINPDGSSIFHLGSTVAVKFQLTGASAGITNAVANLTLAKLTSAIDGSSMEAVSTSAADTGNQFRYDPSGQQYIFNLATSGLSVGTWRLRIDLHDGVTRTINISLK